MSRTTIDFGIDLGTTNSVVAVLRGIHTEVIKNNDGHETTPSAVWIDRRGRRFVGRAARDRIESDPGNTASEFKLLMGLSGQAVTFATAGAAMTPEQLSAEVLKSLRADVRSRLAEDISAAVITVPAAFDLGACDATRRAAGLAGLHTTLLVQEPTAAAHAYGFQATDDNAMWLVYDFGGGTFDAAVIQLRDGEFSVVGHCGDNFLGGKLIDWRIVEELLIPAAVDQAPALAGMARGDERWYASVNKLKRAAEVAKIQLSRTDTADIQIELDGAGRRVEFDYELRRADVERLAEPFLARSVRLCRNALAERGIGPADIEKVIMVGGQTAMPALREWIADPQHGLGIGLDFDHDPMTVVARGAAVFAGAQPLPADPAAPPGEPGGFTGQFEYARVGPDPDPLVVGRISGPDGTVPAGLSIELVNADSRWRSGRIAVSERGEFSATVLAERGHRNTFLVELADATGTRQQLTPDQIHYTVGGVESQPLLTHTIGIGTADNELQRLIARNTGLPARCTITLRTTDAVQRGQGGGMIRIPVLEGEHARADRNHRIGRLEVTAAQVNRTVPAGSEVKVTVEIDASRLVQARVYVPILDEEFTHTINLTDETVPTVAELVTEVAKERERLDDLRDQQRNVDSLVADIMLTRIDDERLVDQLSGLLDAATADASAAREAGQRLRELRVALDAVEDELAWPALVREADHVMAEARGVVAAHGSESDRADLPLYEQAISDAIAARDMDLARQRLTQLRTHNARVLDRTPALQLMIFEHLAQSRPDMQTPGHADRLIVEGRKAIDAGEPERLRTINMQLNDLLPEPISLSDPFSTVRRAR